MTASPRILVLEATGAQGGSVARSLLASGRYRVRALTRRPDAAPSRALAEAGAEVLAGDPRDRASLRAALKGCYGVFGMTRGADSDEELVLGRNLLFAVAASEIEHLVLSTLPSARKLSGGAIAIPCFETRAELEALARSLELPATFVHVALSYERLTGPLALRRDQDGQLALILPLDFGAVAAVAQADLGGIVTALFDRPGDHLGRGIVVAGDELTPDAYAAAFTRALGVPLAYRPLSRDAFAALPDPGAAELAAVFELLRRFGHPRSDEVAACRQLFPGLQHFDRWIARHAERVLHRFQDAAVRPE